MKLNLKLILALGFVVLLGLGLRLYKLAEVPAGLTWDEAALGYNAYSILKTGKDEHGVSFPLVFKSFGDYKPGAYVYAAVPFIAVLGLNEFSTRLPSALAGALAIVGIYLLATELFGSKKVGLFSALVLAISPWHIFYSHGAWEANLFATELVFGVYFLLKFFRSNWPLWPSLLLAALTLYTYQAGKMLTPLLFGLVILYHRRSWCGWIKDSKFWRRNLATLVIFGALALFTAYQNVSGTAGNRLARLSIFSYNPGIAQDDLQVDGPVLASLFHSRAEQLGRSIISRYLYHFSPEVLFYEGSVVTDRGHIPRLGMMYLVEAILLIVGLAAVLKLPSNRGLIMGLLLLSPIPASLTLAEFSTTRSLFTVMPLVMVTALGLSVLVKSWKKWSVLFMALYLFNAVYGLDIFFAHSKKDLAAEFNYGHKEAVEIVNRYPNSRVIFTDLYGQPYIYYLFYTRYDPARYQAQNDFRDGGVDVGSVFRIDQVEFRQFSLQDIQLYKDAVFVGSPINIPDEFLPQITNVEYYQQIDVEAHKPIFRVIKTL